MGKDTEREEELSPHVDFVYGIQQNTVQRAEVGPLPNMCETPSSIPSFAKWKGGGGVPTLASHISAGCGSVVTAIPKACQEQDEQTQGSRCSSDTRARAVCALVTHAHELLVL